MILKVIFVIIANKCYAIFRASREINFAFLKSLLIVSLIA